LELAALGVGHMSRNLADKNIDKADERCDFPNITSP